MRKSERDGGGGGREGGRGRGVSDGKIFRGGGGWVGSNRHLIELIGNGQDRTIGAEGGAALRLGGGDRSNEGLEGGLGGRTGREVGWGRRGGGRKA